ncbi:cytochrome C oxidase subunit IV family protein [Humisphaera borealis]|uniref:Cytochrome C oxidase subunit IV family protein n=1 Tax=Humisphaera borealis TaxID=2807512 RepID=A0A7M2X1L8_9BACT|nr:cytochrome C oxidase subunit IV family protein [Humisphaera borealis]QOV91554.1 cytochrome C oxidase subunit IV family protein [Humisphaera borealis]
MSHDTTHSNAAHGHDDHAEHAHGITGYIVVFFALMVLLVATVLVAYVHLGVFNVPVAYGIAALKAVLILWFFMHLNEQTRLVQVFAFASFAWLLIFLIMMSGDYMTRGILPRADKLTTLRKVDSFEAQSGYYRNLPPGEPSHRTHAAADHGPATQPTTKPTAGHAEH